MGENSSERYTVDRGLDLDKQTADDRFQFFLFYINYALLSRFDSIHITQGPDNGTYSIRAHNNGEAILNVSHFVISVLNCCC